MTSVCIPRDAAYTDSIVRNDYRTAWNFAVWEQMVRLARPLQRKLFDQHPYLSRLGQADHLHELRNRAPVRRGDGTFLRRAVEVDRKRCAAETHNRHMSENP